MDALASIPISIAIGFRQYLEEQKPEQLDSLMQSLRGSASGYRFETHPYHHIELIEWLTVRIDFERLAEGRTVSPGWYFSELLHRIEVQFLRSSLDALLKSTQGIRGVSKHGCWNAEWIPRGRIPRTAI